MIVDNEPLETLDLPMLFSLCFSNETVSLPNNNTWTTKR